MARRTKEQIIADLAVGAKMDKHHENVRVLCGKIKTANHARNRGLVVELAERLRGHAIALLEHQAGPALASAKASEPPAADASATGGGDGKDEGDIADLFPNATKTTTQAPAVPS